MKISNFSLQTLAAVTFICVMSLGVVEGKSLSKNSSHSSVFGRSANDKTINIDAYKAVGINNSSVRCGCNLLLVSKHPFQGDWKTIDGLGIKSEKTTFTSQKDSSGGFWVAAIPAETADVGDKFTIKLEKGNKARKKDQKLVSITVVK